MTDRTVIRVALIVGLLIAGIVLYLGFTSEASDSKAVCAFGGFLLGLTYLTWDTMRWREGAEKS